MPFPILAKQRSDTPATFSHTKSKLVPLLYGKGTLALGPAIRRCAFVILSPVEMKEDTEHDKSALA